MDDASNEIPVAENVIVEEQNNARPNDHNSAAERRSKLRELINSNPSFGNTTFSGDRIWGDAGSVSTDSSGIDGDENGSGTTEGGQRIFEVGSSADSTTERATFGSDTRRRKKRSDAGKSRTNNYNSASDRTESTGRTTEEKTNYAEPSPIRKRRRRITTDDKFEKAAFLGLIAVGITTVYDLVAFFQGAHWSLQDDETKYLTEKANGALEALPGEYYAIIRENIEKFLPLVAFIIAAIAVTIPRLQYSAELRKQRKPDKTNNQQQTETVPRSTENDSGHWDGNVYRSASSFR